MEQPLKIADTNALKRPSGTAVVVLLCIVLVFATMAYGAVDAVATVVLSLLIGIMILIWASTLWRKQELEINISPLLLPILAWVVLCMIQIIPLGTNALGDGFFKVSSWTLSLDPFATRIFLVRLALYLIFFAAASTFLSSSKRNRRIAVFIIAFGALMAFYGILQWLAKPEGIYGLRPTPQAIPFSSYVNQHHFAALMEMTLGMGLGVLLGGKLKLDRAPLLIFALIVMVVAVVLTGSRGGILSVAAVIGFVVLFNVIIGNKRPSNGEFQKAGVEQRLALVAGAIVALAAVAGMVLFLGGTDSLLRSVGMQVADADFTTGRSHFWKIAWQIFLAHPISGAGFDSFGVAYTRFDTLNGSFRVEQAHNEYLQTLADGGILAFAALIFFIYLLFRKGLRVITETTDRFDRGIALGALAGCVGILTHSFFDFPLRTPANAFFFLTLAALGTNKVAALHSSRHRKSRSGAI